MAAGAEPTGTRRLFGWFGQRRGCWPAPAGLDLGAVAPFQAEKRALHDVVRQCGDAECNRDCDRVGQAQDPADEDRMPEVEGVGDFPDEDHRAERQHSGQARVLAHDHGQEQNRDGRGKQRIQAEIERLAPELDQHEHRYGHGQGGGANKATVSRQPDDCRHTAAGEPQSSQAADENHVEVAVRPEVHATHRRVRERELETVREERRDGSAENDGDRPSAGPAAEQQDEGKGPDQVELLLGRK